MSAIPPLPMIWDGESLRPTRGFAKIADRHYTIGETYLSAPVEERSEASHRHEFAWLRDAWANLPEHLANEFPTAEHFRKRLLIDAGFYHETPIDAGTNAAALRVASYVRAEDDFAAVVVRGPMVVIRKAKSQSRRAMDKDEFQSSKTAILEIAAALLDVAPEVLRSQGSGGAKNPARVAA